MSAPAPCLCGHDLWEHDTEEDDEGTLIYARHCARCDCIKWVSA